MNGRARMLAAAMLLLGAVGVLGAGLLLAPASAPVSASVAEGDSMGHSGPTIVVHSSIGVDEPTVGDTVIFEMQQQMFHHRIVDETDEGFITKGDANAVADQYVEDALLMPVAEHEIHGQGIVVVPLSLALGGLLAVLIALGLGTAALYRRQLGAGLQRSHAAVNRVNDHTPRLRQIAAVAIIVFLVASGIGPFASFGGQITPDHSGTASAAASDLEWSSSTSSGVGYSSPTIVNGTVYIGDGSTVRAYDADTGTEKWSYSAGGTVPGAPTVVGDTVYAAASTGSGEGLLYALNVTDGSQKWQYDVGAVDGSPTYANGTVFMGSRADDRLLAIDESGSLEWTFSVGQAIMGSPTVSDGTVYFGSHDDNLYAVDTATGNEEWNYSDGGNVRTSPTVADGMVYGAGSGFFALDKDTGALQWSASGGYGHNSPTYWNGTVYMSVDGNVTAWDADTGAEEWVYQTGTTLESAPTVAGQTVYVGTDANNVLAIDAATGSQDWSYSTGGTVKSSPTVKDGTLYVGSDDSNLYAIDTGHTESSEGSRVYLGTFGHNELFPADGSTYSLGEPLSGTVTDADGNALDGATVDIVNSSTGSTAASVTTDASGFYEATVDAGTYDVTADADGQLASTKTVEVSEGGTSVDFALDPGPGSVTFLGEDGTEITDRPVEMELYEATDDNINNDAAWWLDEYDGEPIRTVETSSRSNISLADTALEGGQYVAVFRSNDTGVSPIYTDASMVIVDDNTRLDWDLHLVGSDGIRVTAAIRDHTGNWPPADTRIRAESYDLGERYDEAALGAENRARLDIPAGEEVAYFLVREDGTERFLGSTTVDVSEADEPVVFDVLEPGEEWEDLDMANRTTNTSTHDEPWDNETEIHYPPLAQLDASPLDPVAGDTVTYNASASKAFDDVQVAEYNWELPDGSTASGETATWTPTSSEAGEAHTATVEIVDGEGATDQTSITLYVAETADGAAPPPIADANVTTDAPTVGEPVVLESSATAEAGIDKIEWDLNDDGQFTEVGSSAEVVPEESGIQTVGIRVIDENGATDTFYTSFFVAAADTEGLDGTGGSGGASFGPVAGGGSSGGTGSTIVLGGIGIAGYALWRRAGGPGVVTLGKRLAPVAAGAASTAASTASTVVRGLSSMIGRLVGR